MVDGRGSTINREYRERVAEGDYWYLAGQLGGEHLYYNRESPLALLDLAYSLCPVRKPAQARQWRAALWSGQMAVVLDAQLIEDDDDSEDDGPHYLARLIDRLAQILTGNHLTPYERAEAGRVLARLGDPRPEAGTVSLAGVDHSPVLAMQFCYVPAGPFRMGSPDDDELAADDEKPLHQADIPYAYWLSRYPVTVAQFRAFVAAGGYEEAKYWAEARAQGYWEDGKVKRWTVIMEGGEAKVVDEFADTPYDYGYPFNLPNHPVVGVNWYEALAFCHWLAAVLRGGGSLPETWRAMLPGESEWEKGARGQQFPMWKFTEKSVIVKSNSRRKGVTDGSKKFVVRRQFAEENSSRI
jgi:formylglycine-generating enzyme required for sulfatase activity